MVELGTVIVLAGFGGAVRGLVGLSKIWADPKEPKKKYRFIPFRIPECFNPGRYALSVINSACAGVCVFYLKDVGIIAAALETIQMDLTDKGSYILVGMAGIDLLESILGIIKKKK